jgi:hypothetical protein
MVASGSHLCGLSLVGVSMLMREKRTCGTHVRVHCFIQMAAFAAAVVVVPVPVCDGQSLVGVEGGVEAVQVGDVRKQAGQHNCNATTRDQRCVCRACTCVCVCGGGTWCVVVHDVRPALKG